MRIAILGQYPLDTQRLGGVEVAIVYVQRELLKRPDVELHIVTCKDELTSPRTHRDERLTITYLPRGRWGRMTWHRQEVAALRRALDTIRPDIVHAHSSGLYAGAALGSSYPAVVTVHGIAAQEARLQEGWSHRLRGLLDAAYERWVIRRTEHLMLITPYVEQVFDGVFRGRSYLVENACEERFFQITRHPVPGRLFFAGPVIPRKGVLPLLQALAAVRREVPQSHLRVAGSLSSDPDYATACRAYAQQAGLAKAVDWLDHIPQERVLEEYSRCAVFVLPSFQETAPMVIEQAMAAAVPSVATRAGGVPWMLEDGVTGLTIPVPATHAPWGTAGAPAALVEALLQILRDPDGAEQMGQRAKAVAEERFRPEAVGRRTFEVYREVIAAYSPSDSDPPLPSDSDPPDSDPLRRDNQ